MINEINKKADFLKCTNVYKTFSDWNDLRNGLNKNLTIKETNIEDY